MAKLKLKKKIAPSWKPVEISGSLISGEDDFEGFGGLEVLENYDSSFLLGSSKQNKDYNSSELEGDIYDGRKRKNDGSDEEKDDDFDEKPTKKKSKKKQKVIESVNSPGKYVLLKPASDDAQEDLEALAIHNSWNQIGVQSDEILKSLVDLKFSNPTEIQRVSIPVSVFGKHDILGAAPTGSGKTLAFGIPIVQSIQKILAESDEKVDDLLSLILTPTRELAQQIHKHLLAISKDTGVKIACIIGGLATVKQERILKTSPHIVIGTPGRIYELYQDGNDHLAKIKDVRFLVVDETDRMVEKGHFTELEEILQIINNNETNLKRQTFVFSATLTMIHELPKYLKKKKQRKSDETLKDDRLNEIVAMFGMKNPKVFDITSKSGVAEKLIEARILCELEEKDFFLYYILINYPGRTIVFNNSIECVKRNASILNHLNMSVIVLHGKMEQKQRLKNLESFQKSDDSILVTTQVSARGLDIPNVQHVIHYQVPTSGEDYVHRSGRTARADKEGLSILIMEPGEVKFFVKLQKTLGRNEDLPIFPIDPRIMKNVRERVRMAREIEGFDLQVRRQNDNRNWKKQAAEDIGILDSESDEDPSDKKQNQKQVDLFLKQKKFTLGKLLSQQIIPSNVSSLKFPIGAISKVERNPIQAVKNIVSENKKGIKLYRKRK